MKLRNYFVVLIILTLILASCSSTKDDDSKQETSNTTQNDNTEEDQKDEPSTQETENKEADSDADMEETEVNTEMTDTDEEIDVSLLDRVLLESVKLNMPDSYMIITEEISMNGNETTTSYKKGLHTREETTSEALTSVSIYNHDNRTTYSYDLGESNGEAYENTPEENAEKDALKDLNDMSLMTYLEQEFISPDGWSFDTEPIIKASQEKVNGRQAIYVSIIVPTETGEETEPFMQIWFDKKYTVPLKYIINFGEGMTFTGEYTEADFNLNLDDDLFIPPSDINFQ